MQRLPQPVIAEPGIGDNDDPFSIEPFGDIGYHVNGHGQFAGKCQCRPALAMHAGNTLFQVIEPAARYLNAAGACTSLLMVVLVTAHVLSRSLFNKPLVGTVELEELMIVILVFCGLAYTQITRNHISVDFVTTRLSKKWQDILATATSLVNSLFFLILTWQSLIQSKAQMSDGTATYDLQIPLFWVMWIIALGFFLFALSTFTDFLKTATESVMAGQKVETGMAIFFCHRTGGIAIYRY